MMRRKLGPRISILGLMIVVAVAALVANFYRSLTETEAKATALAMMTNVNSGWSQFTMREIKATPLAAGKGWKVEFWEPSLKIWNKRFYVSVDNDGDCEYVPIEQRKGCH